MRVVVRGRLDAPLSNTAVRGIWHEYRDLLGRAGLTRLRGYATPVNLFVIVAFGIGIPWRRGFDFFDPLLLLLYSFIALLFAAPAVTDLLGSDWEDAGVVLARVAASALFGWSIFLLIVVLGIATVNWELRAAGRLLLPRSDALAAAMGLSFAASLAVASLGALLCVVLNPLAAKLILRAGFIGLLMLFLFGGRLLPSTWTAGMAAGLTSRALVRGALLTAAVLLVFSAGPIAALRHARKPSAEP